MNTKKLMFSVFGIVFCTNVLFAQKVPWWWRYPTKLPTGNNFDYSPGKGEGKTETEARRKAEADSYRMFTAKNKKIEFSETMYKKIEENGIDATLPEYSTNYTFVCNPKEEKINDNHYKVYILYAWRKDFDEPVNFKEIDENICNRPPKEECDFSRFYKEHPRQFFLNLGNGINYGNIGGIGFGGRFGNIWAVGFQTGIGLGKKPDAYFHCAVGAKLYYYCFFLSANYGTVGKKKEIKISDNTESEYFKYSEIEKQNFYGGVSFLGGVDYCFGKTTKNKCGGVLNGAFGTARYADKWGFAWNIGIGLVF